MACCHYYEFTESGEEIFSVDATAIKFGAGALGEVGKDARVLGITRAAVFTDRTVRQLEHFQTLIDSLRAAGIEFEVYDRVKVEPTDESFKLASEFAREGNFDGYISMGGGSVIDTCKAANLYATWPADFLAYVNAPLGEALPVPGPVKPHIACPTTSGTGSECTGIAVFDLLELKTKTGIASRELKPTRAVIDPTCTYTLPANVVAASGFDVLSHALESYTALPYTARNRPEHPHLRPISQGANPFSDIGSCEALRLAGLFLERAVADAGDHEARDGMMFAATLAGIAFGNAGVHLPHGMSYSVSGLIRDFYPTGYPDDEPICPHGMSVIVNAPAVFRFTSSACPQRHLKGAELLGADIAGVTEAEAGELLAQKLMALMRSTGMPNGVGGVGYDEKDIPGLVSGAYAQKRLLNNAPKHVDQQSLADLYHNALSYW
ncbi:MAG: iron-containing alcohol dehydrogenase [Gammaproteobacteria bacterium]|nr:iron-containing alcohol dehydrogenase [Gammaproteobacteria bacterium]